MGLYVIYDRLAEESGPVFEAANHAVANRQYRALLQRTAGVSPEEYKLFYVGKIDHSRSVIEAFAVPEDVTQDVVVREVAHE